MKKTAAITVLDNVGRSPENNLEDRAVVDLFGGSVVSLHVFDGEGWPYLLHFDAAGARELAAALLLKASELDGGWEPTNQEPGQRRLMSDPGVLNRVADVLARPADLGRMAAVDMIPHLSELVGWSGRRATPQEREDRA
jgi:hypothetical protein